LYKIIKIIDFYYFANYLQTNINDNINEKILLDNLFNKLSTGTTSCDDIIDINDNNNNYEINFPYFEDNIYVTLYNNDNNNNIVELINNKIKLEIDPYGIYVLIIDDIIDNNLELDQLCKENNIITIYL